MGSLRPQTRSPCMPQLSRSPPRLCAILHLLRHCCSAGWQDFRAGARFPFSLAFQVTVLGSLSIPGLHPGVLAAARAPSFLTGVCSMRKGQPYKPLALPILWSGLFLHGSVSQGQPGSLRSQQMSRVGDLSSPLLQLISIWPDSPLSAPV